MTNYPTSVDDFTHHVDDVDYNMAADVNELQDAIEAIETQLLTSNLIGAYNTTKSLSATETLTDASSPLQYLNPNSADRIVELPAEAATNHAFVIANTSTTYFLLTVKNDAAAVIGIVYPGETAIFVSDGTTWKCAAKGNRLMAFGVEMVAFATAVTTGDGKVYTPPMPQQLNGYNVIFAFASVGTTSSSGTPTVQIARGRQAAAGSAHTFNDVLSTRITIDANEYCSLDAAAAMVINGTYDDIATGDIFRFDCDVAGTGTQGLFATVLCAKT